MLVISVLFLIVFVLLLYALREDTGKNTRHSRNQRPATKAEASFKKRPLRMGDSLF
ncbi:hypothetical protein P2G88_18730 [Aliiglaciecola sp. CAU 1673]|uniref:hypothetical protein n=1 Tax=Aliiglaciecola sp. CAU 1673 TaxID=3032595 RepID=UPI0023DCA6B0|nr:hypothetical protein [Aliiglaciecola sp. CAU 1673]MDF2180297.1 hypothetical protein [Aliiglaciecola sp. CAU 1673]